MDIFFYLNNFEYHLSHLQLEAYNALCSIGHTFRHMFFLSKIKCAE